MTGLTLPDSHPAQFWQRPEHTTVARCLLLALLLHVWLVLVVGSAPSGTAVEGQAVGGRLNVRLGLPSAPPASVSVTDVPPPAVATGPVGEAPSPRWGGAVRDREPPPADEPGTARLGNWGAQATGAAAQAALPTAAPLPLSLPSVPTPALPTLAAPVVAAAPTLAAPQALNKTAAAAQPALSSPALPATTPLVVPAVPTPTLLPPVAAQAGAERNLSSAVQQRPAVGAVAPLLTSSNSPANLETVQLPGTPALKAAVAPAAVASPVTAEAALGPALPSATTSAATSAAASAATPAAAPAAAPDAGTRLGFDVATPAAQAASAPARLNLNLPKPTRGGELSRMAAPGVLQLLPRPPDVPGKLARDIEKAAKEDCTKAYAGAGILAVIPLAVDAVRKDGGCKW